MEEITISINGQNLTCPPGSTILQAAEKQGIHIPTLCHHPELKPYGACRVCLVEDQKSGRLLAACVAPVMQDMQIATHTERILEHRRNILRLMMAEHPESCIVCSKGNRCRLRGLASSIGLAETGLHPMPNYKPLEEANPFIIRDLSKCILCAKCIRADHELVAVGAIDYNQRGFQARPATLLEKGLEQSSCTFCGTCVSLCPTGALSMKNETFTGTPEREAVSVCGFCGVGCKLKMGVFDQQIVEVNPAHLPGSVNGATLCVRGHFAQDCIHSPKRLIRPMLRTGNRLQPVSLDEALSKAGERLSRIKAEHGPQSIGLLGSSKCSNEENYLFQKLARVALGSSNLDNGGYVFGQTAMEYFESLSGGTCRSMSLERIEHSDLVFVLGADPAQSAPVVSYALKRAKAKGIPLILATCLPTELDWFATLKLTPSSRQGLDHLYPRLLNTLAALFIERSPGDAESAAQSIPGFAQYQKELSRIDPQQQAEQMGLDLKDLHLAVDHLEQARTSFVLGQNVLQQKHCGPSLDALFNLSLLTKGLGRSNNSIHFISQENNLLGALDMGTGSRFLPGRLRIDQEKNRSYWEKIWKTKLSPDFGLDLFRMIIEAEKGNLKALYIMGENPVRSLPQSKRVQLALEKLELIIVQDVLQTETTELAHILLPGAMFAEKSGSFTNMEGRIQPFAPVLQPPGEAREDWRILDELLLRFGQKPYGSFKRISTEINRFVPLYTPEDQAGHPGFLPNEHTTDEKLTFAPLYIPDEEAEDLDYPYTAVITSSRLHLGSGTRTGNSRRIRDFQPGFQALISGTTAEELGLAEQDPIRIVSRYWELQISQHRDPELSPGIVLLPMAFHGNKALNLIPLSDIGHADRPESFGWTNCRVRLEHL